MIIAISGACHSGKTTYIEKMYAQDKKYNIPMTEVIRTMDINIDEIRKDPRAYLEFEKKVISKKIMHETAAFHLDKETNHLNETKNRYVYFLDRSLVDSYYYLTHYMNFTEMDDSLYEEYEEFRIYVLTTTKLHLKNLYDGILLLTPIPYPKDMENDLYRPKALRYKQLTEFESIKQMTFGLMEPDLHNKILISSSSNNQIDSKWNLYNAFSVV